MLPVHIQINYDLRKITITNYTIPIMGNMVTYLQTLAYIMKIYILIPEGRFSNLMQWSLLKIMQNSLTLVVTSGRLLIKYVLNQRLWGYGSYKLYQLP